MNVNNYRLTKMKIIANIYKLRYGKQTYQANLKTHIKNKKEALK